MDYISWKLFFLQLITENKVHFTFYWAAFKMNEKYMPYVNVLKRVVSGEQGLHGISPHTLSECLGLLSFLFQWRETNTTTYKDILYKCVHIA